MTRHLSKQLYTGALPVTALHHHSDLTAWVYCSKTTQIKERCQKEVKLWERGERVVMWGKIPVLDVGAIICSAWARELQTGADNGPQLSNVHGSLSSCHWLELMWRSVVLGHTGFWLLTFPSFRMIKNFKFQDAVLIALYNNLPPFLYYEHALF